MTTPLAAASDLRERTGAEWTVVTAGAAGAIAAGSTERLSIPAYRVRVRHTRYAEAGFSGGLAYGLLRDWPIKDTLRLASACSALRCERAYHEPLPTMTELNHAAAAGRRGEGRLSSGACALALLFPCR